MSEYLEELVGSVQSSANWRAQKAEQYLDDPRNKRSSAALTTLASRLRELADDDEQRAAYEAVMERAINLEAFDMQAEISATESRYIGRYGFDYPEDGDPRLFLEGLTELVSDIVEREEKRIAEEESEANYEAACEAADEEAKEIADQEAKEAATEAAKEAAEEAYKEAYEETYKEAYDEAYKEALIRILNERED